MRKLNKVMRDKRISLEAKGIYGYFMNLPEGKSGSLEEVEDLTLSIEEKLRIPDYFKELTNHGYLEFVIPTEVE